MTKSLDADYVTQVSDQLVRLFDEAVHRDLTNGILLSGGLDTSVITAVASKYTKLTAITVSLEDAIDLSYAKLVATAFRLNHKIVRIGLEKVEEAARHVVRIMRTFDPMEVRNDSAIVIGLRAAKEEGLEAVLTGDGGDELFAGYSFLYKNGREGLEQRLQNMWNTMRFSSVPIARSLGIEAKLPFLESKFKEFAMRLDPALKVREEKGSLYGKWILRKAFEGWLPENIAWRSKVPIEQGSGTFKLRKYFESKICDHEFATKVKNCFDHDNVQIRDKEQLAYYEMFKKEFGVPYGMGEGAKRCGHCGAWLMEIMNYCRICGAYPD